VHSEGGRRRTAPARPGDERVDADLGLRLEALYRELDTAHRLANDPIRFAHRYTDPADQELAGFLAGGLAYGRVAAFSPVIAALLDRADEAGGPAAWVRSFDADRETAGLVPMVYRFNRGIHHVWLLSGLRKVLEAYGALGAVVRVEAGETHVGPALSRLIAAIRSAVIGLPGGPTSWEHAPNGLRYLLPDPADGSAAKRLCMVARWMVRPTKEGVDLGLWTHVDPAHLVVPLDTHVHRIARMVGLTERKDASWRTAVEVTRSLAAFDPGDPVRFDFALAHVGISGGCTGALQERVCGPCALRPVCAVGRTL
jgi:uncharacterized protein (TIGR02757 family)